MNVIYTWHSSKVVRWYNKDFEIKVLIVSLNQSLKFFNRVTLYTDVKSFEELKNYTLPKIEVVFKKRVEHNLWVLDKIATYELQTEPFLHIDADFIFTKNPSEKFLNSEIGFQSLDSFDKCEFYEKKLKKIKPLNIYKEEFIPYSFNFGVYLCNNISLNKDYCTTAKNTAKKLIENTSSLLSYNVIVEQYTMSEVLNNKKTYPSFLIENYTEEQAEKIGFIHILNNKNYYETIQKNIFRSTQDSNPSFIIANNIFGFGSYTPSWITSKTASAATGMVATGSEKLDSIFLISKYSIGRMIGIFDTSTVVTLPISGTFDVYITANPSLIARTYYLIVANTDFVAGTILDLSDWNDFNGSADNSAIPISSVTVAVGQTGKIKFPLDSTSLNLIHANNNFSAYVIGENDKNNIVPDDTPYYYFTSFSINNGLGVSGSGDCVLTLT